MAVYNASLKDNLHKLDNLGLALWFYDDCSLHKEKLFYNINTQGFSIEENMCIAEYLKSIGIEAKIVRDNNKDLVYISVSKYGGSDKISNILASYRLPWFNYKIWGSETIQKWSKLQEELKNKGNLTNLQKGRLWRTL